MVRPIDNSEIRDRRLVRDLVKVATSIRRGNDRILVELVREIGAETMAMARIEAIVARFAAMDPAVLEALGADVFPPRHSLRVVGGRRHG